MKAWRKVVKISAEVAAILLLVFIFVAIIRWAKPEANTEPNLALLTPTPGETVYPPPSWSPTPAPRGSAYPPPWGPTTDPTIIALMRAAEETQYYQPPTPTEPPDPTLMPTPVVTPIPLAEFPVFQGQTEGVFTIVYRQENTLRAVDSDGQNDRLLLDVGARLPLFLINENFNPQGWGSTSPDTKQLALVLTNLADPTQANWGEKQLFDIYLYDLQSGDLRLLVQNGDEPVWSPDGTKIAYLSTETYGLWVMDINSGSAQEVFSLNPSEGDYAINFIAWAPDSQKLTFTRSFNVAWVGEIWITDLGGQNKLLVPMEMYAGYLNWSPDGKTILFTSQFGEHVTPTRPYNLWTVESETGITKQLTENITVDGGIKNWSPDGNWITFAGKPKLEGDTVSYELWMISRDGGDLKRLTNDVDEEICPNWVTEAIIIFQKPGLGLWNINLQNGNMTQIHEYIAKYACMQYISLR